MEVANVEATGNKTPHVSQLRSIRRTTLCHNRLTRTRNPHVLWQWEEPPCCTFNVCGPGQVFVGDPYTIMAARSVVRRQHVSPLRHFIVYILWIQEWKRAGSILVLRVRREDKRGRLAGQAAEQDTSFIKFGEQLGLARFLVTKTNE